MSDKPSQAERDRQLLINAQQKGGLPVLGAYFRLSGPGWIASAITLGGGSLASSLYLGVLGGYSLMWLQPFAMILGVIMLGAIGYVTLSTGERPFGAINNHVNPVLGWGWALAVVAANIIWCMPQFSLAHGVLSQNLFVGYLGDNGPIVDWACSVVGTDRTGAEMTLDQGFNIWAWVALRANKFAISLVILIVCTVITWSYDRGGWGLRIYETVLKLIVAMIVLCFLGVVITLSMSDDPLKWGEIMRGLIPDFTQIFTPAATFEPLLNAVGAEGSVARDFWAAKIVAEQRDVMISAAATAVGINMTFMFPYTMLRKGWTKEFRGLAIFDLSTGMFIPYILATGCVVIAAASQFHTKVAEGFKVEMSGETVVAIETPQEGGKLGAYDKLLAARNDYEVTAQDGTVVQLAGSEVSVAEQHLAACLVRRDAMDLAKSLSPLTGPIIANIVFGLGVLGMVLSTISILMLISGFVFAEIWGCRPGGVAHKVGTMIAGVGGAMWPVFWAGQSKFYLAVVTSVFGFVLLPFAYVTFVLVMNSSSLLGAERPRGARLAIWNILMIFAASVASVGAVYMIWVKAEWKGIAAVVAFVFLAVCVAINRYNSARQKGPKDE
jgi:Mn2+/Fe2+ NRAMP family transporter